MSCEQLFKQQLKKKGLRLTNQRKAVLEILHETNGPVSADEIYQMISLKNPGFDLSTVYRTLELLKEIGLVQHGQDFPAVGMPGHCFAQTGRQIFQYGCFQQEILGILVLTVENFLK